MILLLRLRLIVFVSIEKIYQKLLTMYPDNFVQNTPLRVVFSTLFSGLGYPHETLNVFRVWYKAGSTKVVPHKRKSERDKVD